MTSNMLVYRNTSRTPCPIQVMVITETHKESERVCPHIYIGFRGKQQAQRFARSQSSSIVKRKLVYYRNLEHNTCKNIFTNVLTPFMSSRHRHKYTAVYWYINLRFQSTMTLFYYPLGININNNSTPIPPKNESLFSTTKTQEKLFHKPQDTSEVEA